jgi:hypothetical protein
MQKDEKEDPLSLCSMIDFLEKSLLKEGADVTFEKCTLRLCYEVRNLESGIAKIFKLIKEQSL